MNEKGMTKPRDVLNNSFNPCGPAGDQPLASVGAAHMEKDILDRLEYVAGPWQDFTLAEDAKREIERLRSCSTAALAEWMITNGFATGHGDTMADLLRELTWQIAELRRK